MLQKKRKYQKNFKTQSSKTVTKRACNENDKEKSKILRYSTT